jgi:hypothetical protein
VSQETSQARFQSEESKNLEKIFDEIESKQIELLDTAGKNLLDRISAMLAVLFGITAFGKDFPPAYLKTHASNKYLVIATLASYLLAMLMALISVTPRQYKRPVYNISEMAREMEKIINHKSWFAKIANLFFWLASLALATLIGRIVFSA